MIKSLKFFFKSVWSGNKSKQNGNKCKKTEINTKIYDLSLPEWKKADHMWDVN
uniref:Uncharacterized protein n=1 Tax=Promethearchaeum syntrophicum TaxID=2594042 RepID=A0A5B9DEG6_9ARCH|nr:hypothetical protein DSAG12_03547 [Candidatus Prometheoarchaeum syntrophicum]